MVFVNICVISIACRLMWKWPCFFSQCNSVTIHWKKTNVCFNKMTICSTIYQHLFFGARLHLNLTTGGGAGTLSLRRTQIHPPPYQAVLAEPTDFSLFKFTQTTHHHPFESAWVRLTGVSHLLVFVRFSFLKTHFLSLRCAIPSLRPPSLLCWFRISPKSSPLTSPLVYLWLYLKAWLPLRRPALPCPRAVSHVRGDHWFCCLIWGPTIDWLEQKALWKMTPG